MDVVRRDVRRLGTSETKVGQDPRLWTEKMNISEKKYSGNPRENEATRGENPRVVVDSKPILVEGRGPHTIPQSFVVSLVMKRVQSGRIEVAIS